MTRKIFLLIVGLFLFGTPLLGQLYLGQRPWQIMKVNTPSDFDVQTGGPTDTISISGNLKYGFVKYYFDSNNGCDLRECSPISTIVREELINQFTKNDPNHRENRWVFYINDDMVEVTLSTDGFHKYFICQKL